jgi:hypothetical protein
LTSGTLATRIARSQQLRVLRVAGQPSEAWKSVERNVQAGAFQSSGLDVQTSSLPDATAALAALTEGLADVALLDIRTMVQARARMLPVQIIAVTGDAENGYAALVSTIQAKGYPMTRFARVLRSNTGAGYVDARDLQARIDRLASESVIDAPFPAQELISSVAIMSGVR